MGSATASLAWSHRGVSHKAKTNSLKIDQINETTTKQAMMWLKKPQVHVYTCIGYFPVPGYTGQAIGGAMKNMPMKTGECPKAAGKSETMLPLICRREI